MVYQEKKEPKFPVGPDSDKKPGEPREKKDPHAPGKNPSDDPLRDPSIKKELDL